MEIAAVVGGLAGWLATRSIRIMGVSLTLCKNFTFN